MQIVKIAKRGPDKVLSTNHGLHIGKKYHGGAVEHIRIVVGEYELRMSLHMADSLARALARAVEDASL